MLDTRFPRPRGDIGNALSYDFPVRYKIVRGAHATKIMGDHPDPSLLEPFVAAARELEAEGVKAITTSCGFLAAFQKQLASSVNIPVFASCLIQAPLIHAMLPPGRIIGVFTERGHHKPKPRRPTPRCLRARRLALSRLLLRKAGRERFHQARRTLDANRACREGP
jgi:hypothetical protein